MNTWLLDTNFISELRRPNPSHRVLTFLSTSRLEDMYLSTVVLAELRYGIQSAHDDARRAELDGWLTGKVRPMFAGRVLEVTENIMFRWRVMVEQGRKNGRTFSQPDLIMAATAAEHGCTLVTRNVKDFAGLDLKIMNPWQ